ncbi:MAG: hypothetical protein H0Z34_11815 [Brevibacillus sp.]|nr:hypothetical protein [Brevibacillus sp.]
MKKWVQKAYVKCMSALQNQNGAQAIEWIALAGVVLAIFSAIIAYFQGNSEADITDAIDTTISNIIKSISGKEE